jgi:hypothetical protein
MGFNPYPSFPAMKREAERRQQFVPGLRMDYRVPQLSVGPTPLSPEMGRIQSKVGNVSLHDPDCPAELARSPSARITSRQFVAVATASFSWASDHLRSDSES